MATEPARNALYNRLRDVLGPEHADTLMERWSVATSSELVTKADLAKSGDRLRDDFRSEMAAFRAEVRSDISSLRREVAELNAAMRDYQKTMLLAVVGSMTALTGIFSVVVGLIA